MARPRKPVELHVLHGTLPHVPTGAARPSFYAPGRPKFPRHLSSVARAEFKRACGLLEKRKTLTEADGAAIALYAEVYARWLSIKAKVGEDFEVQVTVLDSNGAPHVVKKLNPLLKVLDATEKQLARLIEALGLTPTAREKCKPTHVELKKREPKPGSFWANHPELCDAEGKLLPAANCVDAEIVKENDDAQSPS